jgi:PIN domain nuclease of toxin-antitoxin system
VRVLLDTHTFLYAIDRPEQLSANVRRVLLDPAVERSVSVIALFEIAVKVQKGKLAMPLTAAYYTEQLQSLRARMLPIEMNHCFTLFSLPRHHGDPFDRLLIAQALAEGLTILTQDSAFASYGVPILW